MLIGSDAPDLPLELVEQAFAALSEHQLVLAPATDGGYVLIGEAVHHPELFQAIAWSTGQVLPETLRRVAALNISAAQLQSWEDLDDLAALQRFLQRSPQSRTAEHLRTCLPEHFPVAKECLLP